MPNRGPPPPPKAPLYDELLAYFTAHPQAQDTVEGIVEWWLVAGEFQNANPHASKDGTF